MTTALATRPGLPGRLREDGYDLPAGLPFERWLEIGETLQQMERSVQWWLGDWWNYGERTYGEMASQASKDHVKDATGYTYSTVNKAGWVAREFESIRRRTNLSWSHHEAVASLPVPDQERLLDAAEHAGMTRYDLRDAVRERKREIEGKAVDAAGSPVEPADELPWIPTRADLTPDARRDLEVKLSEMGASRRSTFEAGALWAWQYADDLELFERDGE